MRLQKTSKKNRTTYIYYGADGKKLMELKPGENGVTEADIAMLHEQDDMEFNAERREAYHAPVSIEDTQIDLAERTIFLPSEKTKGRRGRTVFFSRKTAGEMKKWLRYKGKSSSSIYTFPLSTGVETISVSSYEKRFRTYLGRTSITKHVTPHTLRNNFAKRCLLSGMDIYTLSRILGHSSVTVTEEAYLDVRDIELKGRYQKHSPIKNIWR